VLDGNRIAEQGTARGFAAKRPGRRERAKYKTAIQREARREPNGGKFNEMRMNLGE
jgi:hypothetical protein